MRRSLLAVLLVSALAGCASSGMSPRETTRAAAVADSLGQRREAVALYRDAARRGEVWAQMHLGESGRERRSLGDWLFEARPTPREAARWATTARKTATERATAGDADGHLALASILMMDGQRLEHADTSAEDVYASARHHADAAAAGGDRQAILTRAHIVWLADGLLVAEPFFREAAQAGFPQGVTLLSVVVTNRPLLEQGLRPRDAAGDLTRLDVVAGLRVLQTSGMAEPRAEAAEKIAAMRAAARAGNAEADSLLRALSSRDVQA